MATDRLIAACRAAVDAVAQECPVDAPRGASVVVQFAAGHWAELKDALVEAEAAGVQPVATNGNGKKNGKAAASAAPVSVVGSDLPMI